jgi:hypothetical protein
VCQDYTVGKSDSDETPSTPQLTTPQSTIAGDISSDKVCQSLDPSLWFPVTAATVDFWLTKGPESCRNEISANHYPASERRFKPTTKAPKGRSRRFGNRLFYSTAPNGEKQSRKWLLYSPHTGSVYCFYCTLMVSEKDKFSRPEGFSAWQFSKRIKMHEQSATHRECILNACTRRSENARVDSQLEQQVQERKQYWLNVLRRVIAVVKFLAQRGMPFRGYDEIIGSKHNGNFLGIIELIAQFDPFLDNHLKEYGYAGRGVSSYLSSTIVEELIQLMAKKVRSTIISEITQAKYFSVSVDSTPDISHVDQLTVIVRYLLHGKPVERFLTFLQMESHKAEALTANLLQYLESESIDFMNCRGQSYDNASNMSGRYAGMQALLRKVNPLAFYIPCMTHSLNLVGVSAVDCCVDAVSFFGFVQALYTFFSASTHRWSVLKRNLDTKGLVVKSLSDTRWSARADAVKALCAGYNGIKSALDHIAADDQQNGPTRHEANCLVASMDTLETALMSDIWSVVLSRYNETSIKLQSSSCDLKLATDLLESLHTFTDDLRNRFDEFEDRAKQASGSTNYLSVVARPRKRSRRFDEAQGTDVVLQGKDKFRVETFLVIVNQLQTALRNRIDAYADIRKMFQVVTEFRNLENKQIRELAIRMAETYHTDLQSSTFPDEMIQFVDFAKSRGCSSPSDLALLIHNEDLYSTFPNVSIALRMFMCLMISNCSGERSFSRMALVKNKLRSTMTDERLSALELLSVESDLLDNMSFSDIVDTFASAKSRKCL